MLYELALQFRYLQFYAHAAHNLVSGSTFFQDHEFLGELYPTYETAYDTTVERMIGLSKELDLLKLQEAAGKMVAKMEDPTEPDDVFKMLLTGEHVICKLVEKCFEEEDEYTQGTLNMLAQFADDSESRTYKMQQRIK